MADVKLILAPYLNFNGNAGEAMKFYQSILGGELAMQTFGEAGVPHEPREKDRIIHAALKRGDLLLMASDGHLGRKVIIGDNIRLSVTGSKSGELTEIFNGLAEGGRVEMPMAKQFWGETMGMVVDRFGVHEFKYMKFIKRDS